MSTNEAAGRPGGRRGGRWEEVQLAVGRGTPEQAVEVLLAAAGKRGPLARLRPRGRTEGTSRLEAPLPWRSLEVELTPREGRLDLALRENDAGPLDVVFKAVAFAVGIPLVAVGFWWLLTHDDGWSFTVSSAAGTAVCIVALAVALPAALLLAPPLGFVLRPWLEASYRRRHGPPEAGRETCAEVRRVFLEAARAVASTGSLPPLPRREPAPSRPPETDRRAPPRA